MKKIVGYIVVWKFTANIDSVVVYRTIGDARRSISESAEEIFDLDDLWGGTADADTSAAIDAFFNDHAVMAIY